METSAVQKEKPLAERMETSMVQQAERLAELETTPVENSMDNSSLVEYVAFAS